MTALRLASLRVMVTTVAHNFCVPFIGDVCAVMECFADCGCMVVESQGCCCCCWMLVVVTPRWLIVVLCVFDSIA